MRRIALYGKGGIGKSTISANLSAALGLQGNRVIQIGCDPKHDSTRLLLSGKQLTTVLDYIRDTNPTSYDINAVLETGFAGVGCVEAGGPKPGVGCAGRGIISTFEMLAQFHLDQQFDTVVYDVLGDVVCGGFAVPIRREYADTILIVTSGEFMSLYAANNILRGIRNYDGDKTGRVAGLVFNRRAVEDEEERVYRFAEAVQLPIFADVARSDSFTRAEKSYKTVVELGEDDALCALFSTMAHRIASGVTLHKAQPLSDDLLEKTVLESKNTFTVAHAAQSATVAQVAEMMHAEQKATQGKPSEEDKASGSSFDTPEASASPAPSTATADAAIDLTNPNRYLSKTVLRGQPLHGCAFNGALATALNVADAVVVAHSPRSCANLSLAAFTSTGRRALFERGTLLPVSLAPILECTDMSQAEIVFGGTDALITKVRNIRDAGTSAIVVVSSCPSGIIGDDIDRVADLATDTCPILPLKTDGNMTGDFLQGQLAAHVAIARMFFDSHVSKQPRTVNVFAEKMVVTNTQRNFDTISAFLSRMNISVNCRFLNSTNTHELRRFCAAEVNLPAYGDYAAQLMGALIHDEFDGEVFPHAFPIGFDETVSWLQDIGSRFDCPEAAEQIISEQIALYHDSIEQLRTQLAGKKLMILAYNCELDWILKTALDLQMDIVRIGLIDYSQDEGFRTALDVDFPVVENYDPASRVDELAQLAPDILLTNYASAVSNTIPVADTIPMCPDVGFFSAIRLARRWAHLLQTQQKEEWRNDGQLYEQSFM